MPRMPKRPTWLRPLPAIAALTLLMTGAAGTMADRQISWFRAGGGGLQRDLADGTRRGLRLAAISDGLPCAVGIMQAPTTASAAADYRVISDRDLIAQLDGVVNDGFVPVASVRTFGTRHEVAFERVGRRGDAGQWKVIEFEKLELLDDVVGDAAAEGYRVRLVVRPAFRSWPGLSERGMLLAVKTALPRDARVLFGTKKDIKELARDLRTASEAGWQFDALFTNARDGGASGRRERATVLMSKGRPDVLAPVPVKIERRNTFGIVGDIVVGAAAYWDEYLFVSQDAERRQAWASPVTLDKNDADCGALGLGFRFDAPRDQLSDIVALLAKPRLSGDYEMIVVTNQRIGF